MKKIIENKGFNIIGRPEEGGFATVYKAQSPNGIVRAFKTPKIPDNASAEVQKKIREDFRNECNKLMSLWSGNNPNPNIIKAYECVTDQDPLYLEMDYVEGMPFDKYAEKTFMKIDEVYRFIDNIAGALAYCHKYVDKDGNERSLIHNDLHSANIRYCKTNGDFILFDFGLSIERGDRVRTSKKALGWCEFMPPERCSMECDPNSPYRNTPATPAWDIYSLGCLIYLALTGQAPFSINNFTDMQISLMHIDVDIHRPWEKIKELRQSHFNEICPDENYKDDCPDWLIEMIGKCMARESVDRYQNAQEFIEVFNGFRKKQTVPYDDYINLSKEYKDVKEERNQLQKDYELLERDVMKTRSHLNSTLIRNWIVAIVIAIAFASNCMPYFGSSDQGNISLGLTSIAISIIATLIIIGIAIYDSILLKSNKE